MQNTIYLDSSVINRLVDAGVSPSEFYRELSNRSYRPVIGLHVIYELARTFLDDSGFARGQALFEFLENLDPSISPGSWNLMTQEVESIRTGSIILPFLDHLGQTSARLEISRLARGYFDDRARKFLTCRESRINSNLPQTIQKYIERVTVFRQGQPNALPKLMTFNDAVRYFEPMFAVMITDIFHRRVDTTEAWRITKRLNELPAIRSVVRANIYYSWICISYRVAPAKDKVDDFRHVIEAAYCAALLTSDRKLLAAVPEINPALTPIAGDDIIMAACKGARGHNVNNGRERGRTVS